MMKLATWNVCLGIKGKKDYIKTVACQEDLDICCIQECDIKPDYVLRITTLKLKKTTSNQDAVSIYETQLTTREDRTWKVKTII